jgi:hypothetical protein
MLRGQPFFEGDVTVHIHQAIPFCPEPRLGGALVLHIGDHRLAADRLHRCLSIITLLNGHTRPTLVKSILIEINRIMAESLVQGP